MVLFLIENNHSSPLESVTLSFSGNIDGLLSIYMNDKWSRVSSSGQAFTIDLLNFLKVTYKHNMFSEEPWNAFERLRPELAELCKFFKPVGDKIFTEDVSSQLGNHGMLVELVDLHYTGEEALSRATWRIKAPLSIVVQMLRHRSGSFNQTSRSIPHNITAGSLAS